MNIKIKEIKDVMLEYSKKSNWEKLRKECKNMYYFLENFVHEDAEISFDKEDKEKLLYMMENEDVVDFFYEFQQVIKKEISKIKLPVKYQVKKIECEPIKRNNKRTFTFSF